MSDGYSLFKSGGSWYCRWSEWHNGKRTQPSHRLGSVKHYPKKTGVKPLADEYMAAVRKTQTVEAVQLLRNSWTRRSSPKSNPP